MRSTIIAGLVTTLVCFGLTPPTRAQTDQPTGDDMAAPTSKPAAGRNRLGDETSPYLLQHQHNPVHWWPWGEEAFAAARAADKPIFLSIGYSTCYWCHVMERECFENAEVAAVMNELFVCIKVDREERPDVDDIYMSATQIYNQGRGGWPMSVFIEPETLQPFFAGTYFPAEQFTQLLRSIGTFWRDQREDVIKGANELADRVRQMHAMQHAPRAISRSSVLQAIALVLQAYDAEHGGFGAGRNKFPTPVYLELLMNAGWDDPEVRAAVTHTLDRMATGGMYDQIGGGFHRYSTDREWLVPHFEKMLYDNGQLASAYARAYELTNDPFYAEIVRETLDYVLREMHSADGAFWSAQDAEVNHLEGGNYLWLADEVREGLTAADQAKDVDFALSVYGFDRGTNFQDPHHPEAGRKNVVFLTDTPATLATQLDMDQGEFDDRLRRVNATLLAARDLRDQPSTDDKVLAGWNGLMIAGFADGGRILKSPAYVDAARAAARFVLERMRTPDGGLLRTARADQVKIDAFLEDYAFMIRGLLALARATGETDWIDAAVELEAAAQGHFWDDEHGAWFDAPDGQTDLFVRIKSTYDGATPAGNSAMLNALVDLHEATGDAAYLERARAAMTALSSDLADRPTASTLGMLAVARIGTLDPTVLSEDVPSQDGAVQVRVSPETVALAAGAEARVELTLRIAEGFHVNAHEPGMDDLIPLGIRLIGGDGVRVEPAYPAGEVFDGPLGSMKVHGGEVTIPVVLTRTGAVTGQERIMLIYQACTDTVCLQPVSAVLPLNIAAAEEPTP